MCVFMIYLAPLVRQASSLATEAPASRLLAVPELTIFCGTDDFIKGSVVPQHLSSSVQAVCLDSVSVNYGTLGLRG